MPASATVPTSTENDQYDDADMPYESFGSIRSLMMRR